MRLSYYIYYRVAQPEQAKARVWNIQAALKSQTGIDGRLLEKRDDPATWMEIYEGVSDADAFEQCLAAAVLESGFTAVLATGSARHLECFEDSCA